MKPESRLHNHPVPGKGSGTYVHGHILETGDELEASDVYSSSSGYWEKCPCPGLKLQAGTAVVWVRPS